MTRTQFIKTHGDKTYDELSNENKLYVIRKIMVSTILCDEAILFKIKSFTLNWLNVRQVLEGTE